MIIAACHMPYVSIIMPAWNTARTLPVAIKSVLSQTFTDFELVICDDASQDETLQVLASFSDTRLRVVRNDVNLGEGGARDRAIDEARGQWIAVLDADDAWVPDRLERLITVAKSQRNVMVFDDILECHDTPTGLVPWRRVRGDQAFGAVRREPVNVAFSDYIRQRRLLIKPLFPARAVRETCLRHSARRFGADTEFFLHLIEQGLRLVYVPSAMYLYRITPGSMSANPRRDELMMEILEQAGARMSLTPVDQNALEEKIASVRRGIDYAPFLRSLKNRHWLVALALLRKHPRYMLEFVARLQEDIPYRFHRWFHRARGR